MKGYWTCRKCAQPNPNRRTICMLCRKRRPARKKPAHLLALDVPYEAYIELNGGEHCAICDKAPHGRRLDRDHDHKTGKPRGLLCWSCNRQLRTWATVEWLRSAAAYLERAS